MHAPGTPKEGYLCKHQHITCVVVRCFAANRANMLQHCVWTWRHMASKLTRRHTSIPLTTCLMPIPTSTSCQLQPFTFLTVHVANKPSALRSRVTLTCYPPSLLQGCYQSDQCIHGQHMHSPVRNPLRLVGLSDMKTFEALGVFAAR